MSSIFQGLWPALITPIDANEKPAFAVLERLVDLFARQKLDGLYVVGSTGQWPLFTREERMAIADCAIKASAGRIPIMVHVGAVATEDSVALAKHAHRAGAQAVSSVAPIYFGHPPAVVFEHYRRIGAATDLPLFVYHLSGVSQVSLAPQEFVRRLLELPNIGGMKITDHDLNLFGLIHSYGGDRLKLFSGADEVMCHAVLSGAIGAIGTFYNLWGPACQKARLATIDGQVGRVRDFMLTFQLAIAEVVQSGGIWSFLRAAMRLKYDLDVGMPRPPLGMMDRAWNDADVRRLVDAVDGAI